MSRPTTILVLLLAVALSILSLLHVEQGCITDRCAPGDPKAVYVTRSGWPVAFRWRYSQRHEAIFRTAHPDWVRVTTLPGLDVNLVLLALNTFLWLDLLILLWAALALVRGKQGEPRRALALLLLASLIPLAWGLWRWAGTRREERYSRTPAATARPRATPVPSRPAPHLSPTPTAPALPAYPIFTPTPGAYLATLTPRSTATPAPYPPPAHPATLTPWPTATPAPYPPPATATWAPTPTPTLSPTPVPPRPTPVTPLPCRMPTPPSNESETVAAVVTTLSCRLNDFDYLADQLRKWLNLKPACPSPLLWAEEHDLDSDGRSEFTAAFVLPSVSPRPSWAPCGLGLSTWAVLGHRAEGYYLIRYRGQQEGTLPGSNISPQLVMVRDINGDGHVELVIQSFWSGAATDFTMTTVGQWDGQVWQTLGYMENTNVDESRWDDLDGDGRWEFVVHGNTVGLASHLERPRTDVYGWREGRLQLVRSIPDPDDHPYFLVLDANAALAAGEIDRALALAMRVMQGNVSIGSEYLEKHYGRIVAYAAIEAMLVRALRHEPEAMAALLHAVEAKYSRPDNPYAQAARRLWLTYQATKDPLAACVAVERTMREHGDIDLIDPLQFPGMIVLEALTIEQVCPLDDGLASWPPTGEKP